MSRKPSVPRKPEAPATTKQLRAAVLMAGVAALVNPPAAAAQADASNIGIAAESGSLQARVAAVRKVLSAWPEAAFSATQTPNWTNWPKWSKWSNWSNK